jgi:hypothetical protein
VVLRCGRDHAAEIAAAGYRPKRRGRDPLWLTCLAGVWNFQNGRYNINSLFHCLLERQSRARSVSQVLLQVPRDAVILQARSSICL